MPSLPFLANSGQYAATGALISSWPRAASRCAHSATAPLVADHTLPIVSWAHGWSGRAVPPHRSTTVCPSSVTHTDAPTSEPTSSGSATFNVRGMHIVGRDDELAGLLTAVGRVPAAGLVAAVVSGEAGIGKSHLIGAAAERLAAKAWPVLRVRADRLERQVPYAALAAALRTLASDNSFTEGVRRDAVAALDLPLGTPDPPGTAFGRACARVTRLLTALTAASPLVVVVDDLHELDDDSLALLSVVLPRLSSAPIGFVVALRSHLAEPNAAAQELLDRLADTVELVRVELGTLPAADIGAMIVPLLGAPPDDDLIGEVHRRCDGNPYFAVEIAHSLVEAGVVTVDGSLARLAVAPRSVPLTRRTAVTNECAI